MALILKFLDPHYYFLIKEKLNFFPFQNGFHVLNLCLKTWCDTRDLLMRFGVISIFIVKKIV